MACTEEEVHYNDIGTVILVSIKDCFASLYNDRAISYRSSMEYDGKVSVGSTNFQNEQDLVQAIVDKVCNLFKEADAPGDDDSQLNTQTVAEKIV